MAAVNQSLTISLIRLLNLKKDHVYIYSRTVEILRIQ